ncbi:MAG: histidine kinase [Bacteroidota bacterium]
MGTNTLHKNPLQKLELSSHLGFWLILLGSFTLIQFFKDGNDQNLGLLFLQNLKRVPAMILAVYAFNFYLIPFLYRKRKYGHFALGSIFLFYLASALDRFVNVHIYEPLFREGAFVQESIWQILMDIEFLLTSYLSPLLIATFAMNITMVLYEGNEIERLTLQLERDKNKAELNALKAQIHPHFLFNTLNNLYALTVQKSENAPKMVEALSFMLDYVLYRCNDTFVPLSNEIALINNYIALERLRFEDLIRIDSTFDYDVSKNGKIRVAPLLLLPIVENAFKHGASQQLEAPFIKMQLTVKDSSLSFDVINSKEVNQPDEDVGFMKGIGLKNLKGQLHKLYGDYAFEHNDQGEVYHVHLRIDTASAYD